LRTDNFLAGKLTSLSGGACLPLCCPALLAACGNHSGEAEHHSGIGLKLFGFIPEAVFTFIPESCSRSSRNTVRNHTGIAFTLPRIPHTSRIVCRRLQRHVLKTFYKATTTRAAMRCDCRRDGSLGACAGMAGVTEAKLVRSLPRPTVPEFSPQSTRTSADGTSATKPLDVRVPVRISGIHVSHVVNNRARGDFSFSWDD
jgi:hypothetical protein